MTSLLERQASLIEFMTSSATVFGGAREFALQPAPEGIDSALLRVEAKFSYAKRMEKITAVLPKTFALLGVRDDAIVRAFVEACPPTTLSRLENARQFYRFLCSHWAQQAANPPYLPDVAACEMAFATIEDGGGRVPQAEEGGSHPSGGAIRRNPGVALLRCAYDIRAIFESDSEPAPPATRDTRLVIALPPGDDHPQVFEIVAPVFDLLAALDNWIDAPDMGTDLGSGPTKLLADLTSRGLIEVHP
jgi:hypothetical protein